MYLCHKIVIMTFEEIQELVKDGGWLIFGVAPTSLKMLGQQVTDNTQREIARATSI